MTIGVISFGVIGYASASQITLADFDSNALTFGFDGLSYGMGNVEGDWLSLNGGTVDNKSLGSNPPTLIDPSYFVETPSGANPFATIIIKPGYEVTKFGLNAATFGAQFQMWAFSANNPSGTIISSFSPQNMKFAGFLGIETDRPIDRIMITTTQKRPGGGQSFHIDSLIAEASAPVPEPGTFMLLGSGLLGLVCLVRRKKG